MSPAGRPLGRSDSMKSVEDPLASLVLGTAHEDLFDAAKDYENMNFLKILVEEDGVPVTGTDQVILVVMIVGSATRLLCLTSLVHNL